MTGPAAQPRSDVAEIEAVAADYIEGWYHGDVARMDRALHPDLVKRTQEDDALRNVTKERMLEITAAGGGEQVNPAFEVTVDHVSDTIATARALSPEYLDYLQLVKTPAGWKIANVLFRTHD